MDIQGLKKKIEWFKQSQFSPLLTIKKERKRREKLSWNGRRTVFGRSKFDFADKRKKP